MGLLNTLDAVVIVSYLAGITWIGTRFYRKHAGMSEYLLGSKAMKWFPVALSIIAADTSAISYLGVPAWSFQHDMKLNQNILMFLFAIPLFIWLFLPIYSKGNLYTAYQYLETRFDLKMRLLASVFFLVIRGAHISVIIYAPALMMSELMGVPLKLSILVMGALTAFYTTLGGIKGVIWTDAIQVGTVFVGFTAVALSVLYHIPGGLSSALSTAVAHGKFEFFDFSLSLEKVDNFWAILIGGTILAVQPLCTDQAILQKFFTTNSAKETSKSLYFYGAVMIPLMTLLSVLGVLMYVLYTHQPALRASLKNPDALIPHYAASVLPHGLAGLVVASIFAGSMSTVSASLNSLATSSVIDIYKRLLKSNQPDSHYASASRWATALWGLLATVGALYADRLGELVLSFTRIQSLMAGTILGIFLLGVLFRRVGSRSAMAGVIVGLGAVIYASVFTAVSIYWYGVIGTLATVLAGWLYSFAFPEKVRSELVAVE